MRLAIPRARTAGLAVFYTLWPEDPALAAASVDAAALMSAFVILCSLSMCMRLAFFDSKNLPQAPHLIWTDVMIPYDCLPWPC